MRALACCLLLAGAAAQAADCPQPHEVTQDQMLGLWRAEFEGSWHGATLLFEKHPEYGDSFRGAINRDGDKAKVAGDLVEGEFTLEESADGLRISATWLGDVVEGSCGREIRGTWKAEGASAERNFVLRKQ